MMIWLSDDVARVRSHSPPLSPGASRSLGDSRTTTHQGRSGPSQATDTTPARRAVAARRGGRHGRTRGRRGRGLRRRERGAAAGEARAGRRHPSRLSRRLHALPPAAAPGGGRRAGAAGRGGVAVAAAEAHDAAARAGNGRRPRRAPGPRPQHHRPRPRARLRPAGARAGQRHEGHGDPGAARVRAGLQDARRGRVPARSRADPARGRQRLHRPRRARAALPLRRRGRGLRGGRDRGEHAADDHRARAAVPPSRPFAHAVARRAAPRRAPARHGQPSRRRHAAGARGPRGARRSGQEPDRRGRPSP